ncbi:MAG: methyltransferase domain-containing protein [Solobacterium sp.]|nr:methyltransferase domain-containing protein [Solobacterium sp.]
MFAREDVMKWQSEVCADLMRRSGIREGDTVIDFGCGRGHYAFAAAIAVGDTGTVYGLDTNAAVLEVLKQDAEYRHCTNVIPVKTEPGVNMPFADSSADAVLIYDLIHETELRQPFLQEAHRVLKQGGILSVLPFHMTDQEILDMLEEVRSSGFETYNDVEGGIHFVLDKAASSQREDISLLEHGIIHNFRSVKVQ